MLLYTCIITGGGVKGFKQDGKAIEFRTNYVILNYLAQSNNLVSNQLYQDADQKMLGLKNVNEK